MSASLPGSKAGDYHGRVSLAATRRAPSVGLCAAGAILLWGAAAGASPYLSLRPADQVLSGPTDGTLAAIHYNPAALRLTAGSQLMAVAGARGYFGSFLRGANLPAGFGPSSQEVAAEAAQIRWASPDMMVAGSWDLRSDAVTLALGVYTPYTEDTNYVSGDPAKARPDAQSPELQKLSTRYHAVASHTYSLWGSLAVSLRLRQYFYLGGGFNFAWTHTRMMFMRDLDPRTDPAGQPAPPTSDGLSCSGPGPCEQWSQRQTIEFDGSGWGYGFTTGILVVPIENRLWLSLSYLSPLFTSLGAAVGLDGVPDRLPWSSGSAASNTGDPCGSKLDGARITRGDQAPVCGTARLVQSFPHLIYIGGRGRLSAGTWRSSRHPTHIELVGWARLYIPARQDQDLQLERRLLSQGRIALPLSQQPAVAITFGLRQHWPRLTLGQELLYESPRADSANVSPANLEGHKVDASFAMRLKLHRRLALQVNVGITGVLLPSNAGTRFSPSLAETCRSTNYDVTLSACQDSDWGWAVPSAAGSYTLVVPHGAAGFEVSL